MARTARRVEGRRRVRGRRVGSIAVVVDDLRAGRVDVDRAVDQLVRAGLERAAALDVVAGRDGGREPT